MFQVNYCEYNRSNADCDRIYRPGGSGDYLLLLLKTPMKCRLKGKLEISGENAFLLYAPGEVQDYQAVQKFRNSYVHFSTDLPLTESYGIPTSVLFYPENFSKLDETIRLIQQEYLSRLPYFQETLPDPHGGTFYLFFQKYGSESRGGRTRNAGAEKGV